MNDPIDLSALDPMVDEDRWEARVHETVEQASLVQQLDLAALGPDALDGAVASVVEQAGLLRTDDLSLLAPFEENEDAVVGSILEQAALLEAQDLSPLSGFSRGAEAAVASVLEGAAARPTLTLVDRSAGLEEADLSVASPVVALAPRALTLAACLAAAAWLLVWLAPPASSSETSASEADPALVLMGWAESGDGLTDEQMRVVIGNAP